MDTDDLPSQPVRSELWFEDGTIVLEAEATQFRVYRGILAANSAIFRDMFGLCQPAEEDTVDGCPIVRLHDSAKDLRCALDILHDSSQRYAVLRPCTYAYNRTKHADTSKISRKSPWMWWLHVFDLAANMRSHTFEQKHYVDSVMITRQRWNNGIEYMTSSHEQLTVKYQLNHR